MHISLLEMENFKCFAGNIRLQFGSGINYFVGNNNCGKTTVFRAVEFIQVGKSKEEWITTGSEDQDVSVTITLKDDDLESLLTELKLDKLKSYIYENSELVLRRSSEVTTWTDAGGKEKEITIRNLALLNPKNQIFENPAGIDRMIRSLFDAQFVMSDLNNGDFQDFGKTKIVGKLLTGITSNFQNTQPWQEFQTAHDAAFGENGLAKELRNLQTDIEEIMADQYGETKVEFSFGLPTIESFFKTGQILLEDNGVKTSVTDKGTGMQRALALSLIQVYAQAEGSKNNDASPIIFFLDEPETFLHPMAQDKLLQSLKKLSQHSQVFITTHSPYLLRNFDKGSDQLKVFSRKSGTLHIKDGATLDLFPHSPSWGEINYFAFQVVGPEFHNELFGILHNKAKDAENSVGKSIKSFDIWLSNQNGANLAGETHMNMGDRNDCTTSRDKTMTAYIRNYIDHPGPNLDQKYPRPEPTTEEIRTSIEFMLSVMKNLPQ